MGREEEREIEREYRERKRKKARESERERKRESKSERASERERERDRGRRPSLPVAEGIVAAFPKVALLFDAHVLAPPRDGLRGPEEVGEQIRDLRLQTVELGQGVEELEAIQVAPALPLEVHPPLLLNVLVEVVDLAPERLSDLVALVEKCAERVEARTRRVDELEAPEAADLVEGVDIIEPGQLKILAV